jgi:Patatin-like phospholipase
MHTKNLLAKKLKPYTLYKFFLWAFSLVILLYIWLSSPDYIWSYILLLRVPIILGGLLLFGLPILANFTGLSNLAQNLFIMRGAWQLATVFVSSTMAGLMVSLVSRIIIADAPERFGLPVLFTLSDLHQYGLTAILVLPTWVAVIRLSKIVVVKGAIVGLISSLGLVWLVNYTNFCLNSNIELKRLFAKITMFFMKQHPQGYLDPKTGDYSNGHLLGFSLFFVGLVVYIIVIIRFRPRIKRHRGEAPALLYLMLLIWMGTLLFGGATFYADYFHVPVLMFFILFSGLSYALFDVDHFFELLPLELSIQSNELEDFKTAIDERLKYQSNFTDKRTLVVVCASGGGIQAAGWTVKVLTGLQELLGKSFTQAIGLISSASGGSVGTMYFLDQFKGGAATNLESIFVNATRDSLDAVGWGLAYPDLFRALGFPFLVNQYNDRGLAIEIDWQAEMQLHDQPITLADWRKQILLGEMPIPVFNATLVEDGRRFLITPMTFIQNSKSSATQEDRKAIDFNSLYSGYDLRVATAARLSATFPYVSPISRNDVPLKHNYHVADGGYFDNAGLFTVIEWLDEWLDASKNLNIKRVLLLEINAFQQPRPRNSNKGDLGWLTEWIGPLKTLYSVRDSTQVARNRKEEELLKKYWKAEGIEIESFIISFPEGYKQPLSWKLSEKQKNNLKEAWENLLTPNSPDRVMHDIRTLWHTKWGMPKN